MKRTKLAASFLLAGTLLLTGCVSKKELVNLQTDYNKLKDEKTALDKSYQAAPPDPSPFRSSGHDGSVSASHFHKCSPYERLLSASSD